MKGGILDALYLSPPEGIEAGERENEREASAWPRLRGKPCPVLTWNDFNEEAQARGAKVGKRSHAG